MQCKHLPQDNANVSITYANKKNTKDHKSICLKNRIEEREREREREIERERETETETVGISKTQQRNVKPNLYTFLDCSHLRERERERQSVSVSLFFADSSVQECEAEMRNSESKQKRTNFPTGEDLGSGWVRHGQAGFPGSGRKIGQNTLGFKF